MDSDSEGPLAATLTPISQHLISENEEHSCPKVWGRLYPTRVYLKPIDLVKDIFMFGRGCNCDVVISPQNFGKNIVSVISKVQFKIIMETQNVIFIQDFSKNGTFVNKVLVGFGNRRLLQNDDEISVGLVELSVYFFKKFKNEEDSYLPPALQIKYKVSRLLGEGAYGEVKLLISKTTGEHYAIKKIIKGRTSLGNYNGVNRSTNILNEVKILKSLAHPCIITMHDVLETDMAVFIVLEYMAGGELTHHIISTENPLSEARSKLIFYQIVLGVQYLHKQGITHRDLKPGNILLKTNDMETLVKVSDFGLSKILDDNVFMATICGTPIFSAPEVLDLNCKTYTQQIDIWSMGVILFYMLCKELPFVAQLRSELFNLILHAEYEMDENKWKNISDEAKSLVRKMLVKDPQRRISISDIAKHAWVTDDYSMQETVSRLLRDAMNEKSVLDYLDRQHLLETLPLF